MLAFICTHVLDPDDREYILWLYQNHKLLMYATVRRYISDPSDQEDILQDSILKLAKKIQTLRDLTRCKLHAYIVTTIRNTAINHLKKQGVERRHTVELEDDLLPEPLSLTDMAHMVYEKDRFAHMMDQLSESDRVLLTERFFIGYEDEELAALMGCKADSVRSKATRAKRRASRILRKEQEETG